MGDEVSHSQIYRELGVLQGKMDSLILGRAKDDQDMADIFRRVGSLENRMAQVVIVAVVAGLVLPIVVSWVGDFLRPGRQAQQQVQIDVPR